MTENGAILLFSLPFLLCRTFRLRRTNYGLVHQFLIWNVYPKDNLIKSQLLWIFLLESFTVSECKTIYYIKSKWTLISDGITFWYGPLILWHIAQEVKPENRHLIYQIKIVPYMSTSFFYLIKTLSSGFDDILKDTENLGSSYLEDKKQLNFWRAEKMMDER